MLMFVESWNRILLHRNGESSEGEIGLLLKYGKIIPYMSGEPTLYIHHLDVEAFREDDLCLFVDNRTGRITTRRSMPNQEWWLTDS